MTGGQIILTIIEIIMVVAVVIAVFNEAKIANWERKIFYKIKRKLKIKKIK